MEPPRLESPFPEAQARTVEGLGEEPAGLLELKRELLLLPQGLPALGEVLEGEQDLFACVPPWRSPAQRQAPV